MLLLWLLLSVPSAWQAAGRTLEKCYGGDYFFPSWVSDPVLNKRSEVFFTPTLPPGPTRMVVDEEGTVLDPRFIMRSGDMEIPELTTDHTGRYTQRSTRSGRNFTMNLIAKDCSELCVVHYGGSYVWQLRHNRGVKQIDYSPSFRGSDSVVLWNETTTVPNARVALTQEGDIEVTKVTSKDQGYYTFRDKRGKFMKRYRIRVEEVVEDVYRETGDDLIISYPVEGVRFSLWYQKNYRRSDQYTLIQDGTLWEDSEKFEGRIELLSMKVRIRDLGQEDEGTFVLQDGDDNQAKRIFLTVHPQQGFQVSYVSIMAVAVIAAVIFLCCCGKRCFFGRENATTSSPVTQVYLHDVSATTPTIGERQRQPYSMVATQPTYRPGTPPPSATKPQPEASYSPSPPPYTSVEGGGFLGASSTYAAAAHSAPLPVQGSTAGGVDAPTINLPGGFDCLSGSTFEVPTGRNTSSPLLSSDTPSYDVYTSDKLNFL